MEQPCRTLPVPKKNRPVGQRFVFKRMPVKAPQENRSSNPRGDFISNVGSISDPTIIVVD